MKLLIVEYINGGGYGGQALPPSLAAEGRMMLQVLLNELKSIPGLTLVLPLDRRCSQIAVPKNCEIRWLEESQPLFPLLESLIAECDAIWPIAPESDGILVAIAKLAESAGKQLLLSDADTVALCGDKLLTSQTLIDAGIAAVETLPLSNSSSLSMNFPAVLKPRDGVGCDGTYIASNELEYQLALSQIMSADGRISGYVIQPLLQGDAISLSALFKSGQGVLLTCNQQRIHITNNQFVLSGCLVNDDNPRRNLYQTIIGKVAASIPGLWGYIGIDIIETVDQGPVVLEINPRLTTSYAGIGEATGLNIADRVLQLLTGELESVTPTKALTVNVAIH